MSIVYFSCVPKNVSGALKTPKHFDQSHAYKNLADNRNIDSRLIYSVQIEEESEKDDISASLSDISYTELTNEQAKDLLETITEVSWRIEGGILEIYPPIPDPREI